MNRFCPIAQLPLPCRLWRNGGISATIEPAGNVAGEGERILDKSLRKSGLARALSVGLLVAGAVWPATTPEAAGNLAARAERLEPLLLNAAEGFSIAKYEIETGVYYRWRIESDGREEYKLLAPELFRNSWIDQISIEDKEVKPFGLYAVEFDDEGTIDVWFMPVRPGKYRFYIEGLASQGFEGVFEVR